jgi:starch phosphorylase
MTGTRYTLEVQPRIPERLDRLTDMANDLLYSWDRGLRSLFYRLDRPLWFACRSNPKVFLRRVAQDKLEAAAKDRVFMEDYNRVVSSYDTYHQERDTTAIEPYLNPDRDLVAYFCAEFGFHESFPIYSGGLGILAGDHCKAASDLNLPFIAVGLLYRQGYFNQTIDMDGNQNPEFKSARFGDLPITPAKRPESDEDLKLSVDMPGRQVVLKVWQAKAGHITLYLLDSDLADNSDGDREITHRLYGGDETTRIEQEIVLGIGGVRALRALGEQPSAWHINEGHAAFQILERCREGVRQGIDFASALELVAATTVFTTHTPVEAGHDRFDRDMIGHYFADYLEDLGLGSDMQRFLSLGETDGHRGVFNMTTLALRGSRFHNGVSAIHGRVASAMEASVWPQIPPHENPIDHITNGIHVPSFLAMEWANLFNMRFGGGWRNELLNPEFWERIDEIPDHSFWSLRQSLKTELLADMRRRVRVQLRRNSCSEAHIKRLTRYLEPQNRDILMLGFARRFATYKRATLIFRDEERLARLLNDEQRPVLLIFAGKAHPSDGPGQDLIRTVHRYSRDPRFQGKILLLEGYNIAMARKLLTGVDVWLNNPRYPEEASGTSGEKAGVNGVINLSVLDGWWAEGYDRKTDNGWAITPHGPETDDDYRDQEESQELLDLLENSVIPLYFQRDGRGYSQGWVRKSKASMKTIMPRYNAARMVMDYVRKFYGPASEQCHIMRADDYAPARELAAWKEKIRSHWSRVHMRRLDDPVESMATGQTLPVAVTIYLNGLSADDVRIECIVGTQDEHGQFLVDPEQTQLMEPTGERVDDEQTYRLDLGTSIPGLQYYEIRAYPYHRLLTHKFEMGCMIWL